MVKLQPSTAVQTLQAGQRMAGTAVDGSSDLLHVVAPHARGVHPSGSAPELLLHGSGGVEVEGLKDVAFSLAPVTDLEVERMFETTWAGRKLKGFRNIPPADREAVRHIVVRLAQLAADHPQIAEIEINPLRVLAGGLGAVAVDVRIRKKG